MRANNSPRQFTSWHPFTRDAIAEHAPDGPAAVQLRTSGVLLDYPEGRSAMVCYIFATTSARQALTELLDKRAAQAPSDPDESIEFRIYEGDGAREWLVELIYRFESTFGSLPLWNQRADQNRDEQTE